MSDQRGVGVVPGPAAPAGFQTDCYEIPSNPDGRICLAPQTTFGLHRSGWTGAMDALIPEHSAKGVIFEGFLDRLFDPHWPHPMGPTLPLTKPWTGVFHNPPGTDGWHSSSGSPQTLIASDPFRASLPACRGLFTLSDYLSEFLRKETGLPTSTLRLPTEIPERLFSMDDFANATEKKIVMVGWWLRKLASIYFLPLDRASGFQKFRLINNPSFETEQESLLKQEFVKQSMALRQPLMPAYRDNTHSLQRQNDADYDQLLSTSIVFLDLYDSSANNAVVECIARGTPVLINRIPPVEEYLGADYPFYFQSLDEAAAKTQDLSLVAATHEYLLQCPMRKKLATSVFLDDLRNSEVYQHLLVSSDELHRG
ncbi:hypothetical protein K227x_57290 [Rubripirellula lacrimiformis]|uniref:Exostosin GT47 domain-containing protein n=1 Tax=Rubripirellula lacrimiformis TaxID=1930273 RepID=A0A517NJJ1_9BACT|nr:hypothetical protein [Rubripirellula lacrimiformis]QDT07302.1 hypothetical protein K227x_57290 [Rubripirellula lacrimiformis]